MQKDSHHRVVSANKGVYNQWRSHCINYNICTYKNIKDMYCCYEIIYRIY